MRWLGRGRAGGQRGGPKMTRAAHARDRGRTRYPISGTRSTTHRPTREEAQVPDAIGVLIADDDQNVLDVLTALITAEPTLRVVGAVKDAEAAIDVANKVRPDVALVDARMPGGGG